MWPERLAISMALWLTKVTQASGILENMSNESTIETIASPGKKFAITMIWAGLLGWFAAFSLVVERINMLMNPGQALSCDVNPFISCASVMKSAQASMFGFPNPIIGLGAFVAPIAIGVAILAGAKFAKWFWRLFFTGVVLGFIFVIYLFITSTFVLGVLCPYCMLAWIAMIAIFWAVFFWAGAEGVIEVPEKTFGFFMRWSDSPWVFAIITEVIAALIIFFALWEDWLAIF